MSKATSPLILARRHVLRAVGSAGLLMATRPAWGQARTTDLPLLGGPTRRPFTSDFPQKRDMILQRARPPLLETPFEVFDQGIFTPNDRFYVRWHWAMIPTDIDTTAYRLQVHGHVQRPLALSLQALLKMPRVEIAAVNQCAGNSRGLFEPRVTGAQWANGAMGNALWTGVRLRDVLEKAGVKAGAVQVRFAGMDEPVMPDAPDFSHTLAIDHARSEEVILAYAMNGDALPLLNGYPLRLIVPGWFGTYWVKMLNDIEVLDQADSGYWMAKAYQEPQTPGSTMAPGQTGVTMGPVGVMPPRSFITNLKDGATVKSGQPALVRGIAFGGNAGLASVMFSMDDGRNWQPATLGQDHGDYSFRGWQATFVPNGPGPHALRVRATNTKGETQPMTAIWNPGGYSQNRVEATTVTAI